MYAFHDPSSTHPWKAPVCVIPHIFWSQKTLYRYERDESDDTVSYYWCISPRTYHPWNTREWWTDFHSLPRTERRMSENLILYEVYFRDRVALPSCDRCDQGRICRISQILRSLQEKITLFRVWVRLYEQSFFGFFTGWKVSEFDHTS